jgi:GH15 family glucan-1,4-alpha-glucosidase
LILDFIDRHGLAVRPMKAIYPPVHRSDPDWRDYAGMLNTPRHYHNGSLWPFIGGFYVAALLQAGDSEKPACTLEKLSARNATGQFNEWHHGETGEPAGVRYQAWSAGMYIYAQECVARDRVLLLDNNASDLPTEDNQRQRRNYESQ